MNKLASTPRAMAKLIGMRDATREAQAAVGATMRRISELTSGLATAPTEAVADMEHEISRLHGRLSEQQDRFRARAFIDARVESWLATLPTDVVIEAVKPVKPRHEKGITRSQAVTALRERITALSSERLLVQQAPLPAADLKAMARDYVARLQERGAPRIIATEDSFAIALDATLMDSRISKPDLPAILSWLAGPQLLDRLHAAIDAQPQPKLTLSAKAKADRLLQIATELARLELDEEALIEQSEVEGPIVSRRPDASVAAVLGVKIVRRASAAA